MIGIEFYYLCGNCRAPMPGEHKEGCTWIVFPPDKPPWGYMLRYIPPETSP